jgi:hypothetical protein
MGRRFILINEEAVPGMATFHETDDGKTENCAKHGEVVVALVEYPAENRKWVIKSADAMFFKTDESKKALTADTQERVFRFDPSQGTGVLVFAYRDPWNAKAPDTKTVSFTVIAS